MTEPVTPPAPTDREAAAEKRSQLIAIGMILLTCLCFSILDATAKYLTTYSHLPPLQIVWMRFVSHLVIAFFMFRMWAHPEIFRTDRPWLQFVRGLTMLGTTSFNFLAVQYLQLAETMSIFFAGPIVVTALAGPLLGEWAGIRRWVAIFVGFMGVLIIVQPGSGAMHWAVIFSVASMLCYALYALMTRMLTATNSTIGMLVIPAVISSIAMTGPGLAVWVNPPDLFHWVLLLSTGVWGGLGHWIFIAAHRRAPAPLLAPFTYLQIIWMIGLGFLVFGDIPGSSTIIGASVVVASGLYILYREQVVKKR
ncbi:MAG: DMT family transporter [Pannonibacter sp.]